MSTFYIETFGCKFNQTDSELIKRILKNNNFQEATEKVADFIILNSCGVVERTEKNIIKRIQEIKKKGNKKIILAGCLPIIKPNISKENIDGIIGPKNILELPKVIKTILKGKKFFLIKKRKLDKAKMKSFYIPQNTVYAIIPISEGCISNCSYCATKLARGNLESFDKKAILKNIKTVLNMGVKEIQLTSQDLTAYGFEKWKFQLPDLLKEIVSLKGDFKIRLGMANPLTAKKIINELISIMKSKKIYKFLHLPVQSGNNEVLKMMNRNYLVDDFLSIVEKFRKNFKDTILATDIICGFPQEKEEEFKDTLSLIEKIKPEILHIFKYSKRSGTKAEKLKDFPNRIKKERSRKLTRLWTDINLRKNKKLIGKKYQVLVTEKRENSFLARTNSYRAVILKDAKLGEYFNVKIINAKVNYLIGKIV
ncbi:MAG: tRNA (N(6)-L-threonylcarbamoyladenosine(37)-C(2))-methylthiotransferase [Minisyncoccia bacterium]